MENSLIPSGELFNGQSTTRKFMQDGTPAHRSNSKSWFEEKNKEFLPWCPRSLDLNLIENKIPLEICMCLIESMRKRVRVVLHVAKLLADIFKREIQLRLNLIAKFSVFCYFNTF